MNIQAWPDLLKVLLFILLVDIPLLLLFMLHCYMRQYTYEWRAEKAARYKAVFAEPPPNHLSTMMGYLFFVLLFDGALIAVLHPPAGIITAVLSIFALGNSSLGK